MLCDILPNIFILAVHNAITAYPQYIQVNNYNVFNATIILYSIIDLTSINVYKI